MEDTAYKFWERIDNLRGKTTLAEIAKKTGVKEQRIAHLRSDVRYPKLEDCILIAEFLGTSLDYLVFGDRSLNICPEAQYVNGDAAAQTLVSAIMKDPPLLSALSLVIKSARDNMTREDKTS